MTVTPWLVWFILALVFLVGEIFTAGFFIFWFGVGAAAAGVLALCGVAGVWQWTAFIVVSIACLLTSKRFARKVTSDQPPGIGADRNIGKCGTVTEAIDNEKNCGAVRIEQDLWRALSESGAAIAEGTRVRVSRIEGTHLIVSPVEQEP